MDEVERHYNQHVLKPITVILICAVGAFAQDATKAETPKQEEKKTEVRINMLNVCTPSEAEQQEIKAALDRIPKRAVFTPDFEVSRGRATMEEASASRYLRLRRELDSKTGFNTAQYSISTDADKMTEKLVMKVAKPKDLLQITLEDRVTASAPASALLALDTPVNRISLERFGKASLALARCEGADQKAYEPLFQQASEIAASYRKSLGLRSAFRNDLMWLMSRSKADEPKKTAKVAETPKAEEKK
jgi:hypothetical protein